MGKIITLMTDFGTRDHYVGVMKGVIASINPEAKVIDLCHEVPPQDLLRAAFMIRNSYPYFPPATVHVVVVDPGVGSARNPIIVEAREQLFIGPDNGVFSFIYAEEPRYLARKITNRELMLEPLSSTFHGRDVFSPAAARVSMGFDLGEVGPLIDSPVVLDIPRPRAVGNTLVGNIVHVDSFGNLVSNIGEELLPERPVVKISKVEIRGLRSSYSEAGKGEFLAIVGSAGFLEISLSGGSAAKALNLAEGLHRGVEVVVEAGD